MEKLSRVDCKRNGHRIALGMTSCDCVFRRIESTEGGNRLVYDENTMTSELNPNVHGHLNEEPSDDSRRDCAKSGHEIVFGSDSCKCGLYSLVFIDGKVREVSSGVSLGVIGKLYSGGAAIPEPAPKGNGQVVVPLVLMDVTLRAQMGEKKYGTYLRSHNGRDSLMDAYQEAIDLVMYLRQAMLERDGK